MYDEYDEEATNWETPEGIAEQKEIAEKIETVMKSYKKYAPDTDLLRSLLAQKCDFIFYEFYSGNIARDMSERFQAGITQRNEEANRDYMCFLRKLYSLFTEKHKALFAQLLLGQWQKFNTDYTPYFESICRDFDDILSSALLKLTADENALEVVDPIRWSIIISPPASCVKMLFQSLLRPEIMPTVLGICHSIPMYFHERPLRMWHTEFEVDQLEPVMTAVLRRLIFKCRSETMEAAQWDNLETLALALCDPNAPDPGPLMDHHSVLTVVLADLYTPNRIPAKSVELLVRIAARILNAASGMPFNKQFAVSRREQPKESLFMTPTIIHLMLQLIRDYAQSEERIVAAAVQCLKSIGARMSEVFAVFDEETRERLIGELAELPWWIEYAFFTWFSSVLKPESRRVPHAVLVALLSENEQFEAKPGTEHCDLLTSLVELALFDVDCATELLHECSLIKIDGKVVESLTKALAESCGMKMALGGANRHLIGPFFLDVLTVKEIPAENVELELQRLLVLIPAASTPPPTTTVASASLLEATLNIPALDEPIVECGTWPSTPPLIILETSFSEEMRLRRWYDRETRRRAAERVQERMDRLQATWRESIAYKQCEVKTQAWIDHKTKRAKEEEIYFRRRGCRRSVDEEMSPEEEESCFSPIGWQEREELAAALS
ncbi:unnamed protein product [Caenorhabditis sp. 36 PRJEB53466]|nr:unnamed protein product [Caenorhabditis sp. 36 PRJEB53466]